MLTRALVFCAMVMAVGSPVMGRVAIMPVPPYPIPVEPPACPTPPYGYTYRWVPPQYRTVVERVWVPERTQMVEDWVQISPGKWEKVWRTVTIPGHYETVRRTELVAAGYWQLVRVDPPVYPRPVPMPRPVVSEPGTVGVEGYSKGSGEDLSKFSGLSEWPDKK
jgi:hypothetical protein